MQLRAPPAVQRKKSDAYSPHKKIGETTTTTTTMKIINTTQPTATWAIVATGASSTESSRAQAAEPLALCRHARLNRAETRNEGKKTSTTNPGRGARSSHRASMRRPAGRLIDPPVSAVDRGSSWESRCRACAERADDTSVSREGQR